MKQGFIRGGQYWARGKDGLYRNAQGLVCEDGAATIASGTIVRNYEHVAHQLPFWEPKTPGEKPPYPHVVEVSPGKYTGAFKTRREIQNYAAKHGLGWDL